MSINVQVIFYSMYGHVHQLAEAIAAGARDISGADVHLFQVPELIPEDILARTGAKAAREAFSHIPLASIEKLAEADALILGSPTRYGNMAAQMRNFLDQTGKLWAAGALVGKIGSAFTSTGTQHGGQETTLLGFYVNMLHLGMLVVGVPYSEPRLFNITEMSGGTPYGATTIAGSDGKRKPSDTELAIARFQGRHVAQLAQRLKR